MSLSNLQTYYKSLKKEHTPEHMSEKDRAMKEARSEGHEVFESDMSSGMQRANKILEAIKRKNSYTDSLEEGANMEKATYPRSDWGAIATAMAQGEGETDFREGQSGAARRDYLAQGMEDEHGPGGYGKKANWRQRAGGSKAKSDKPAKKSVQAMQKQMSPALASLMSAAAGWAFSGDVGQAGQMTPEQARNWERELSAADRRKMERSLRSKMRSKGMDKTLDKSSFDSLKESYSDSSDEYIKRSPEKNDFLVRKEHSVLPPRQGLMWDAVKHRWTRPENVGHTVTEVQGKKRYRGVGTGAHERTVSGHGHGKTRQMEAGRRFKGQADVGALKPHENKRPAGHSGPIKRKHG